MPKSKKNLDVSIGSDTTASFSGSLVNLLDTFVSQEDGDSVTVFSSIYLREVLLSKYVDKNTDPAAVRRHRAIVKWLGVEQLNQRTNERLYETDPYFKGLGFGHVLLSKAARRIERVLGRRPPEDLLLKGSFSGGATTSVKRGVGTLAKKFSGTRDVTPRAWHVLKPYVTQFETWALYSPGVFNPRFVKGNILFTVPKTALIDRVACKEPDFNIFAQKSVGDYIRSRLRRKAGIDLNDQSVNRRLAHLGSVDGKLATIDLSSASDSLTTGLVALLLPFEWFKLLDALRCDKTFIDGASHTNEMFSSMGNGFTFELESLIFWALAHTVRGTTKTTGQISVFGDDIIVPSSIAGMLIQLLSWVGFRTNVKKTFYRGRFRESCGGHYYRGHDVTPFYLRAPAKDLSDLILLLNQYRQWLILSGMDTVYDGWASPNAFVQLWNQFAARVPKRFWGGQSTDSRTQLCSPGRPQCELVRLQRRHRRLEDELQSELYLSRLSLSKRVWSPLDCEVDNLADDNQSTPEPAQAVASNRDANLVTSPLDPEFCRDVSFTSLVSNADWGQRRARDWCGVFGLAKPLFITEQLLGEGAHGVAVGTPAKA